MKRLVTTCGSTVFLGWMLFLVAGKSVANALGQRFGSAVLKIGEGKIPSAVEFLHQRLFEAVWLFTLFFAWAVLHAAIQCWVSKRDRPLRLTWLLHAVVGFVALNLWLWEAGRTAGFWIAQWDGILTQNLTRFHIKMILAREQTSPKE